MMIEKKRENKRNCITCGNIIEKYGIKFCSKSCSAKHNNKGVRRHGKPKGNCILCDGKLKGDVKRSMEIELYPNEIQSKNIDIEIGTAGSIGLIFQSLKLPACNAEKPINIRVKGGATFGKYAPPTPYTQSILLPVLRKTGYEGDINIIRHGFFPVGGADVSFHINPCKEFKPIRDKLRL